MNAPLRLFAADYGILVIEGDILHFARLTPSEVAERSTRILEGEAPQDALQPDGEEVPVREIERLEGDLLGRNMQIGGPGWAISLGFPDRKSRDAAMEALAESVGRGLGIRRVRSGWELLAACVLLASALGVTSSALKEDWPKALEVAGQGGLAILVLLVFFVRPRRKIGLSQK